MSERHRGLVHLRLVGERRLHRTEAAHRAARRVVGVRAPAVHRDVRHDVGADPHQAGVADDGRAARRVGAAVEPDLRAYVDQVALVGEAVLVVQLRRVAVHVSEEGLLAVVRHLHRLAGAHRQQAGVHVHREVLATTERTADAGQREPHLLGRQPESAADLLLVDVQPLGRDVEVDTAVLGRHRETRLRTEERLVLHADLVVAGHHDVGLGARVALADLEVPDQVAVRAQDGRLARELHHRRRLRVQVGRRPELVVAECRAGVGDRLEHLVVDLDAGAGAPRRLGMVGGDERDRLALVEHHVRRPAPAGRRTPGRTAARPARPRR